MSRITVAIHDLAESLVGIESRGNKSALLNPLVGVICEKLRPSLATLMGQGGFRALLDRALTRASAEAVWLRVVQVKADGTLDGLETLESHVDAEKRKLGSVVLIAQLLSLLVSFIGEDLTARIVREVWPKVSFKNSNIGLRGKK